MKYSKDFVNKYSKNREMIDIMGNANKVFSPYFKNQENLKDIEIVLETLYGFKIKVADEHELSMEKIYDRVYHLEKVRCEDETNLNNGKSSRLGYFSVGMNLETDKQRCSTITLIKDNNIDISNYRETLTHELVHLFSQEYIEDENRIVEKTGRCGLYDKPNNIFTNEVITQKIALDILDNLNYKSNLRDFAKTVQDGYVDKVNVRSRGSGYPSISQTGNIFCEVFDKTVYSEMFDNTRAFSNEINSLYAETSKPLETINLRLKQAFTNNDGDNYIKLYSEIFDVVFHKVEKEQTNVADYLNTMSNINNGYGCGIRIKDKNINILNSVTVSREIEHFYKIFNNKFNPETDLEQEINPFTRSKDCTNFLIVMQALKTNNVSCEFDKIQDLSWKSISRDNDKISLTYKYDNIDYFVSVKKDLNTGLTIIQQHDRLSNIQDFKKPSLLTQIRSKESTLTTEYNLDFISKYSQISDYSQVAINTVKDHKSLMIHALITDNYSVFKENTKDINVRDIIDSDNNNVLHVLARHQSKSGQDLILKDIIDTDKQTIGVMFNLKNSDGLSPATIAIQNKNFSVFEKACEHNANIKNTDHYNNMFVDTKPLIHHLHDNSYYSAVESIINGGYNVNTLDGKGNTILHYIAKTEDIFCNELGMINALIRKGANPNIENLDHLTPLIELCKTEYPSKEDVQHLCDGLNADTNYKNQDNRSAIHYLMVTCVNDKNGSCKEVLLELIEQGANINIPSKSFVNNDELILPIQVAVGSDYSSYPDKHLKIDYPSITVLVENGADIDKSYGNIPSALEMAHFRSDVNMFKSFIDGGADVEKLQLSDGKLTVSSQMEIIQYSCQKESLTEVAATKDESAKEEVSTKDISGPTFELGD